MMKNQNNNDLKKNKAVLCVDFGTSHTLAGVTYPDSNTPNQQIQLESHLKNISDPFLMRTLLYFPNMNECYYGADALNKFIENNMEGRIFRSFKAHLPNKNYLGSMIDQRILNLETLIGIFLLEVKKRAEVQVGHELRHIILGKPARYSMDIIEDEFAIYRMKKAAEYAGFSKIEFVPEPLAAALEYRKKINSEKIILVGDFGGGTSDFTILKMTDSAFKIEDVLAIDGCSLAGDALDSLFMSQRLNKTFGAQTLYQLPMSNNILKMPFSVMERLNKPSHIVHLKDKETYHFIKEVQKCALKKSDQKIIDRLFILIEDQQIFPFFEQIEKTKKFLSSNNEAQFKFTYPDLETDENFTTTEFNQWSEPIFNEISLAVSRCLISAKLQSEQIDSVFLTGGTAYVPQVKNYFINQFGKDKIMTQNYFHSILMGLLESAKINK